MLANHGFTYCVFLLARAARERFHRNVAEWIDAARTPGSHLSSVDLRSPADTLIQLDLARQERDGITMKSVLLELCETDNHATLRSIVRVVLAARLPQWLHIAVTSAGVAREYIPEDELNAMVWLEPDLDQILIDVWNDEGTGDRASLLKALDDAAEHITFAALAHAGAAPIHVAQLSNSFGYDIEARSPVVRRIEVKAAGTTNQHSFDLARNEFDKSQRHGAEWRLWQVVFSSAAFVADTLDASHVEGVLELTSEALSLAVPADLPGFVWTESAHVTPPPVSWNPAAVTLDPDFTTTGFRRLRGARADLSSPDNYTT